MYKKQQAFLFKKKYRSNKFQWLTKAVIFISQNYYNFKMGKYGFAVKNVKVK